MKNNEFVNELKYYQMFLGEVISDYYINEAIHDLFDQKSSSFIQYGNCLGHISSALLHNQQVLCNILLTKSKEGKSIPKTLGRLFTESTNISTDVLEQIKEKAKVVLNLIEESKSDLSNLKNFRDNIYAHFNNNLFIEDWKVDFKANHPFDFKKIVNICINIFDIFSQMLEMLGEESYYKSITPTMYIDRFIKSLS